ncbi:hypothetical protein [Pedobacter montanisoli]|uniref:Outer membrane protein beta-barrel domain-containing protein n=1 Tax=Pedobacter montanisoli TaxID=2923277 RepID=A0ABS9ZZ73_9SPHI|nr:hypothetical protein [Pedobacter montanisoli]MCJ0743584.1 hypothetical protein [Pedobacter montanisoli]
MKHLTTILFFTAAFAIVNANAQVKKTAVKKQPVKEQETKPVAKAPASTAPATIAAVPQTQQTKQVEKENQQASQPKTNTTKTEIVTDQSGRPYKAALGIKFMWGISATGKYFFKKDQAIEAIVRYRSYSGLGNDIAITALYQYEKAIPDVAGLHWLVGAGPYYGNFSYKKSIYSDWYASGGYSYYGLAAMAGLEYKFNNTPIAISADWMPAFDFNGGGFGAESGGFGIKYTF